MEIKGKVHCLFEQSGTFKNEFRKLGYEAFDYDIRDEFGETDYVTDLFREIANGYAGQESLFDRLTADGLVIAFFPCIYFTTMRQFDFTFMRNGTQDRPLAQRIDYALDSLEKRTLFHGFLYKLLGVCEKRKLRLIIENPATAPNYLITGKNFPPPTFIDKNRMERGDYFKKPTAYWFFNCEPTHGFSRQNDKVQKIVHKCEGSKGDGLCSTERSMISPDYARNWICDFVLGKDQHLEASLFDEV